MAATAKGTRRRHALELRALERLARDEAPTAYAQVPARLRRSRLERLHRDLASGRVQLG